MRRGVALGRGVRAGVAALACCALANCSSGTFSKLDPRYGVSSSPRVIGLDERAPKGGGTYRVGQPYVVAGRTYVPEENPNYRAEGLASWYGSDFHGRLTANGEVYDMHSISAAHPTLPIPSYARVTNLANGRSLIVRVNDRGPYHRGRVIDVSVEAARLLDFYGEGLARVRVEYVSRAPLEGSDDSVLLATLRNGQPAPPPSQILLASAKAFPSLFNSRGAARSNVPVPPERPFTLGEDQGGPDTRQANETSAMPRRRRAETASNASFDARFAADRLPPPVNDMARNQTPVAAFAAPQGSPSIMSGRGLY